MKTILISILFLSGCSTVNGWEINIAVAECLKHNGVDYLVVNNNNVRCNDGTFFNINKKVRL